jgi:Skp family chaperone for outer membrane proteins
MRAAALWAVIPILFAATWLGAAAQNPTAPSTRVGYVSSLRISSESTEGRSGVAKVQALQREKAAELRQKQQTLEATRARLPMSTAEARPGLEQQEQAQRADLERAAARAQLDVQMLQRQVNAEVLAKVKPIAAAIAKAQGIQVVLDMEGSIVWADSGLDLTDQVLARLNAAESGTPPPPK